MKIRLTPGEVYKCINGTIVQYLGNGYAITKNLVTNKKIRITRPRVSIRMLDTQWSAGCANALGCTVDVLPNNAVHVRGPLAALEAMAKVISTTHGFYPVLVRDAKVDGVPLPGYPRIEVHPSNVVAAP
jgi:hypothetical protein